MAGQPKAGELNQAFQLPQPPLLPGALGPSYFCFCLFSLFRGGIYIYLALAVDASPRISPQVEPSHAVVIVEGNYLLLKGVDPWDGASALFDQTWAIRCPPQVCGERCGAVRGGAVRTKKLNTCSRRLATLVLDRVDGISLVFAPVEGRTLKKNVMPVVCVGCVPPPPTPPIQASRYLPTTNAAVSWGDTFLFAWVLSPPPPYRPFPLLHSSFHGGLGLACLTMASHSPPVDRFPLVPARRSS